MQEIFELVNSIFNYADIFELQDSLNNVVDSLKETADTVASAEGIVALEETIWRQIHEYFGYCFKRWLVNGSISIIVHLYHLHFCWAIPSNKNQLEEFMLNIKDYLYNGNINAAKNHKNSNTPIARMIEKGLTKLGKPHSEIDQLIESVGKLKFIS